MLTTDEHSAKYRKPKTLTKTELYATFSLRQMSKFFKAQKQRCNVRLN